MWGYYERFPTSKPREAKGGIKAQSKRGSFGETWWAKRWIAVMESFDVGARLQRGRSYARRGQVLSIDVTAGTVKAKVQGSQSKPYAVTIGVAKLTDGEWSKVTTALAGQAVFAAKLLAGEMPAEVEQVARDAGVSLFPTKAKDLETDCSCPDWSNPCKHVAAVYYLLAETFDRDPFLLFRLRGLERATLFARLNAAAPQPADAEPEAPAVEPLPADPRAFWPGGEVPADLLTDLNLPPVAAALPRRLGPIPLWRGRERFLDEMEVIYRAAAQIGAAICLGDTVDNVTPSTPGKSASVTRKSRPRGSEPSANSTTQRSL